jgi:hypothetical protein
MTNFNIKLLGDKELEDYRLFLKRNDHLLFYSSIEYKCLLETYLKAKPIYYVAYKKNKIIGCLPLFESQNHGMGTIINSLPFYGSNGGFLIDFELTNQETQGIMSLLYESLSNYIGKNHVAAITIITSPFDNYSREFLTKNFNKTYSDYRIGQVTGLPKNKEDLIKLFDNPRPRNIKKAIKSGVTIRKSTLKEDFDFLFEIHQDNMERIQGKSKSKYFFELVKKNIPEEFFSLYIAELNGRKIAALLLFYFNNTVEYFTPCSIHEYRNLQATSLLINTAMEDAIDEGYQNWNWGGTWKTQKGVYDFKKKWGASDKKYFYFTKIINKDIIKLSPEKLMNNYPNFYTLPFEKSKKLEK